MAKKKLSAWPPKFLSPVAPADLKRSRGDDVIDFAEALCRITEDGIAGNSGDPLVLRPWQKELTRHLFAEGADGSQRHRRALIGMPRKSGKSAWLSALVLEQLVLGPQGGQIFSCAADKDQAKIIFNTVKRCIELEPELSEILTPYRDVIHNPKTGSVYRALSSESFTKEGLNSTFIAFDELHAQPNRELYDVMSLSMGARKEPMLVAITTAGVTTDSSGKDSLCYSMFNRSVQIAKGEIADPNFFFAWWGGDEKDDYTDEKIWQICNPGFNDLTSLEDMRSSFALTPEAEFKTKRLNIWTSTITAWLPSGAWDALELPNRAPIDGEDCILAFDGAFSNDSTALVAWFLGDEKPHLQVVGLWERPEDAQDWYVPIAEVEQTIINAYRDSRFSVKEVVFDPARWQRTFMVLDEAGLPVVSYPNSAERMVPATQQFYEAVVNQSFTHDGDERLARHIANCVTKQSSRGVMVAKASSKRKVDAAVASIFGYDRATRPPEPKAPVTRFFSIDV
jgi:phage terminase large subunit-like protein